MTSRFIQMDLDLKINSTQIDVQVQSHNESHITVQYKKGFLKLMSTHILLCSDPNQKHYCSIRTEVSSNHIVLQIIIS